MTMDLTNSQETIMMADLAVDEFDKKIAEELNKLAQEDRRKDKRFPSDHFYRKFLDKVKELKLTTSITSETELKIYLKTNFLRKIEYSGLSLDSAAKDRLLYSKFLRCKGIDLVLQDDDLASNFIEDRKEKTMITIIVRWLNSDKFSDGLLWSLKELDLTNRTQVVINIQSPEFSKTQQRHLRKLVEAKQPKPRVATPESQPPKIQPSSPLLEPNEEQTMHDSMPNTQMFIMNLQEIHSSTQQTPFKRPESKNTINEPRNPPVPRTIDAFIGAIEIPKTFEEWNVRIRSDKELLRQAAGMVRDNPDYVRQLVNEYKKKNPGKLDGASIPHTCS